jgi:peptidylprolyl isomerase
MTQAKQGDKVKVHYQGSLNDGTVFDSSYEREPLEFTLGQGQIIPGFEDAVEGMTPGENKKVTVEPDQGYGQYFEENQVELDRSNLPEDLNPEIGMLLQVTDANNQTHHVKVIGLTDETITLDANHPLAGQDLNFDIELVEVGDEE